MPQPDQVVKSTFEQDLAQWEALALKALKGKAIDSMARSLATGVTSKALYTEQDLNHSASKTEISDKEPADRAELGRPNSAASTASVFQSSLWPEHGRSSQQWPRFRTHANLSTDTPQKSLDKTLQADAALGASEVELAVLDQEGLNRCLASPGLPKLQQDRSRFRLSLDLSPSIQAWLGQSQSEEQRLFQAVRDQTEPGEFDLAWNLNPALIGPCGAKEAKLFHRKLTSLKHPSSSAPRSSHPPAAPLLRSSSLAYVEAGADATYELACLLGQSMALLRSYELAERSLDQAWHDLTTYGWDWELSLESDMFVTLAKLRAARVLWHHFSRQLGSHLGDSQVKIPEPRLTGRQSMRELSMIDPWNNMLRSVAAGAAAYLGSVSAPCLIPMDALSTFSSLEARDITSRMHHVLHSEAYLGQVADPAGGSYYLETLTHQLAEQSWQLFTRLEDRGGLLNAEARKRWHAEMGELHEKRQQAIACRGLPRTGVTQFPHSGEDLSRAPFAKPEDPSENPSKHPSEHHSENPPEHLACGAPSRLADLPLPVRDVAAFEQLRLNAHRAAERGIEHVEVPLLCLGEQARYQDRLNFVLNALAVGGLKGRLTQATAPESSETKKTRDFAATLDCPIALICGADASIVAEAPQVISTHLATARRIVIAGHPKATSDQVDWARYGVKDFLHVKTDLLAFLKALHQDLAISSSASASHPLHTGAHA